MVHSNRATIRLTATLSILFGIAAFHGCFSRQATVDKADQLYEDIINNRDAASAFNELVRMADSSEWFEQRTAMGTFGRLGPRAIPALPSIRRATRSGNGFVEREAVITLGKVTVGTDLAVDELVTIMFANRADCSAFAADALGEIGEPARRVLPDLWRAAQSNDESIRLNAWGAISKLKGNHEPCCFGTRPSP